MRSRILLAIVGVAVLSVFQAQATSQNPDLAGVGFLVGHWISDDGKVLDTGGTSRGSSDITLEANGTVLLRRDHTDLFDKTGKPTGGFDQVMMIYPEDGTLHADYSDGKHVIHYKSALVVPGHSVVFTSPSQPSTPTFRLSYELTQPSVLTISFAMAPPGQSTFRQIATGTAKKLT